MRRHTAGSRRRCSPPRPVSNPNPNPNPIATPNPNPNPDSMPSAKARFAGIKHVRDLFAMLEAYP